MPSMPDIARPDQQLDPRVLPGARDDLLQPIENVTDALGEQAAREKEFQRLHDRTDRIVVLTLENRSYDHVLGWLGPERGGLAGDEANPGPSAQVAPSESSGDKTVFETTDTAIAFDPPHGLWRVVRDQINDGAMDGFVTEFARKKTNLKDTLGHREWRNADIGTPMAFYGRDTLPSYRFLVERFLVCGRYFASAASGTWVNRMFFYAGTSGGLADDPDGAVIRGDDYQQHMPDRLLLDLLEEHGVS